MRSIRWMCLVSLVAGLTTLNFTLAQNPRGNSGGAIARERGQLIAKPLKVGGYWQYLPTQPAVGVLVVGHGRPEGDEVNDFPAFAEKYARMWVDFAEQSRLALLVPVFDEAHFGSASGKSFNFGGLFGTPSAADDYVTAIIDRTKPALPTGWDGRVWLYGDAVGARFATHYAVQHADRVRGLAVTASGHYPMPNPDVAWPNGMKAMKGRLEWATTAQPPVVAVSPDPLGWSKAALIPTAIIIGALDNTTYPPCPGHNGTTRVEWANQYVDSMNQVAQSQNRTGRTSLVTLPGVRYRLETMAVAAALALQQMSNQP